MEKRISSDFCLRFLLISTLDVGRRHGDIRSDRAMSSSRRNLVVRFLLQVAVNGEIYPSLLCEKDISCEGRREC
ncbi:uncharacterized protein PHALS_04628 [Plasmopara halstedii]|uniref:Uncharacterized protein n=1 Tax=Plasmopara halstedii TaxID=4781 RepID=A0A0P1A8X5_PLAHL|nr:uncharacterized protein PHALS_04628 [Plasmopara halstedii]CEG37181.1 hypothetical protein PHALS_04628 [Plasmopara halstedii]|eukprot:XP_024573550.1 hypothetical protein PHALS_04628 [Plasmopara halstedii]